MLVLVDFQVVCLMNNKLLKHKYKQSLPFHLSNLAIDLSLIHVDASTFFVIGEVY
jgi:uncharacterized membrane protein YwaF